MTVPATLTLTEACRRTWPVVVVGAGPAGAVTAAELARRGVTVLLVDRAVFPRDKVCGSCLNGRALTALAAAGLADVLPSAGAVPLRSFRLAAGSRSVCLALPGGVALSRRTLDSALVGAAVTRGVAFLPSTRAQLVDEYPPRLRLSQAGSAVEVRADLLLAADGLGGTLRPRPERAVPGSRIGAGVVLEAEEPFFAPGVVYMSCGAGGYVGLVRVEEGRLDLACAVDPPALRQAGGPVHLAVKLIAQAGWPIPEGLVGASWRGTPPLTRQGQVVAGERVFILGDAAGYIEPFTGEGLAWALTSAVALADLTARGWRPGLARTWVRWHRRQVRQRQLTCRTAAFVLRRPVWVRALVGLLSWLPWAASPVLHHLNTEGRGGWCPSRVFRGCR